MAELSLWHVSQKALHLFVTLLLAFGLHAMACAQLPMTNGNHAESQFAVRSYM